MAATYKAQIMSWNWPEIVRRTQSEAIDHVASGGESICVDGCDDDGHVGSCYLGSVYGLTPSGKFYMPWTTNQTADDVDRDSRWYAALEQVADKNHGWIESGEGAPDDLFFSRYWLMARESRG